MDNSKRAGGGLRKRAISLIEGILYLVIALAVIVGGIVFFQQSQLSNNVNDTARAAVGISSQARALYQNQTGFGENADLTVPMIRAGAVPSNFIGNNGDGIAHPFGGGGVTVTGNGAGFVISYRDISQAACLRLASVDESGVGPMGTGIVGFTLSNGSPVDPTTAPELTGTVNASSVSASCTDGTEMAVYYTQHPGSKFAGTGGSTGTPEDAAAGAPDWCPPSNWAWNASTATYTIPGFIEPHSDARHPFLRKWAYVNRRVGYTSEISLPTGASDYYGQYGFHQNDHDHWSLTDHFEAGQLVPPDPNC